MRPIGQCDSGTSLLEMIININNKFLTFFLYLSCEDLKMLSILYSICSRTCLQQSVATFIFEDSQSFAYGIFLGLCFRDCPLLRSLGVSAFKKLTLSFIGVHGLWINIDSTLQRNVDKHSSMNSLSPKTTFRERFTDLTKDSHIRPIQGLTGSLNFHFILFAGRYSFNEPWPISFMAFF